MKKKILAVWIYLFLLTFLSVEVFCQTTNSDSVIWVWRNPSPTTSNFQSQWHIVGELSQEFRNIDTLLSLSFGNLEQMKQLMHPRGNRKISLTSASNGTIELSLSPHSLTDTLFLKEGAFKSIGVNFPYSIQTLPHFNLFGLADSKGMICLYPTIYINKKGELEMLMSIIKRRVTGVNTFNFNSETEFIEKPLLIGTAVASSDEWTPVTDKLEIRGGGLAFSKEGIYLLPNTQTRNK